MDTARRGFLQSAASVVAGMAMAGPVEALAATRTTFPKGFRWGVSTAAHQIEGNNTNSDFWFLENIPGSPFKERSGDACDSYNRYEEDILLIRKLGLDTFRLSIEWARIEPNRGYFSNAELDHYKRVIACCHRNGVTPAVTFFHGTAPRWFAEAGGWLNKESPDLFANFVRRSMQSLGDGMGYAFTINEPNLGKIYRALPEARGYLVAQDEKEKVAHAVAARMSGSDRFVTMDYPDIDGMTPQLIAAHERAFSAIKAERSDLQAGVNLSIVDFQPANADSPYEKYRQLAYGEWLEVAARAGDFVGVQPYHQIRVPGSGTALPAPPLPPFAVAGDRTAAMQQPAALGNAVEYVHSMTRKPVFVTENGIETSNDQLRCWYIPRALAGLKAAVDRNVPVIGYLHWSLLDNFEWSRGYGPKFGLVAVDRQTFKRTPKASAALFAGIARRNNI
jgi:beta-glucosidase